MDDTTETKQLKTDIESLLRKHSVIKKKKNFNDIMLEKELENIVGSVKEDMTDNEFKKLSKRAVDAIIKWKVE